MRKSILITAASLMVYGCGSNQTEADLLSQLNEASPAITVSRTVLDEMMQTLPSPIETANLISRSTLSFNKDLLIPTGDHSRFNTKYTQALALGGYGVDLGYLNLNNKNLYVLDYLESIRNVSKDMKVDQFFDFSMMNNLAKNRSNVDSLIHISTQNFNQIDEYLRSQNRGDLSVLILIGAWLEGLHMFNSLAESNKNQEIIDRIAEQKVIIDNIYAILGKIEHIAYYTELKNKLAPLKKIYESVKISYVYQEPEMKEVNGELVVIDKTEMQISISKEQLAAISKEIKQIRSSIFL